MGSEFGIQRKTKRDYIPPAFVLLHSNDDVLVCCRKVRAGDVAIIDGNPVVLSEPIDVGHKIARRDLVAGNKIRRYNAPIGSMTQNTPIGTHVHTHNLKSDYIPSHGRDAVLGKE